MRQWMCLLAVLSVLAAPVAAADRPVVGPVPGWVQPAPAEIAPGPATDAAVQVLLIDQQLRFSTTATETYIDNRVHIQTPQGLQTVGTIALAWQPDADVITVHRLIVRRGTQVRNLLGNGQDFTILRREDRLEQAALTGTLTAILQPTDLQVGDIVEFAYTRRHADLVVPDKPDLQFAWRNAPIQSVRFRAQWPQQMAMRWQLRDFKPAVQESSSGDMQSIAFTLENPTPLLQPTGAPARFAAQRRAELTAFQSWPEVSRRFAPLYEKAAKLSADSPLRAEIERIRKASADPKQRATAALRLVQEQVRYVLLAMNDGALVPATADQTWQRRYGDCKAKTTLLLALLRELGIEAEAVVVNSTTGDGINQLLPAISAFDHVLVRAQIAGKTWWLDGTRASDRNLDLLRIPSFGWGLPLNVRGAELVRIQPAPSSQPELAQEIFLDASAGVDSPGAFQGTAVFSGDAALGIKLSLDNVDTPQRDQIMRNYWRKNFDGLELAKVASSYDEPTGNLTWVAQGTLGLDWDDGGWYEVDDMRLGFKPDLTRPAGTDADAPYAIAYPEYSVHRAVVSLPAYASITLNGKDIDKTLFGQEYRRTATLTIGVLTAESSTRSLVAEVSSQEAHSAEAELREMNKNGLYLHRQQKQTQQAPTKEELLSRAKNPLATAVEYLLRGQQMWKADLDELAIADYTSALALDAELVDAYIGRAMARDKHNQPAAARTDLEAALQLEPKNIYALRFLAALAAKQGHDREALELFGTLLEQQEDQSIRALRASLYIRLNELEAALSDLAILSRADPANPENYERRGDLLKRLRRPEALRALAKEVLSAHAGPADGAKMASSFYLEAGDKETARSVVTDAISKTPTAELYLARSEIWLRGLADPEQGAADLAQVLKLDPAMYGMYLGSLMSVLDFGIKDMYRKVLQILDRIEADSPGNFKTRLSRGQLLAALEQPAAAMDAFTSARTVARQATEFNSLCWQEAIAGIGLKDALRDCDVALVEKPKSPAYLDSRGLVLLRLGRYDEAIASYDAAIAASSQLAASFYGRGVAKLQLGRKLEGEADLAAARDIDGNIDKHFESYGLKR